VGYLALGDRGLIAEANLTAAGMLGVARGALAKQPFSRFILEDDQDVFYLQHKRLIETGEPQSCELRMVKADGALFWARVDTAAGPLHRVVMTDISGRKRVERELEESKRLIESVVENIPLMVFLKEAQGLRFVVFNRAGEELLGHDRKELMGRNNLDLFPPEQAAFFEAKDREALATGDLLDIPEEMVDTAKKGRRVLHTRKICIKGTDGVARFLLGISEDITERKRAEEETARLEEQLLQAQKMESVGRLAGGVAHDFNNMLGVILGRTEFALEKTEPSSPLRGDLMEIRKAAERSADLTRQLLAFARRQTIAPKVLDLNETVEGMFQMLRRLLGENVAIDYKPESGLWPVRVDPSQIDQILANLCVNARDAITDVGKLTIETGNRTFDEEYCAHHTGFVPGEYVRLVVSDDGCGMDKETLSHLFEPFFTTKKVGQGTGLGLATVYGAVKQNNGFINVYSEPGRGTTFTIYLPRHAGETRRTITEGAPAPDPRGREVILLVEDEPAILRLAAMMLEKQGYTVVAAATPGEAIRLARERTGEIDLLMTDVVMPEMNGRELARNILTLYPGLRRLFMSGYTADVIAHQGVLEEGVHFIQKPFGIKELAAKVREVLDSR
jgi:two-component system, cell cycle sensor histidine kinase and response regulator CckA